MTRSPRARRAGRPQTGAADKLVAGWREWVGLPALGVSNIKAKLDTGARTSALHAFDIRPETVEGEPWVRFVVRPMQRDNTLSVPCAARLVDRRDFQNSGGTREKRYVIETLIRIGDAEWPIELALANRDQMGFRMLVGRTAMKDRLVVDPARSFQSATPAGGRGRRSGAMEEE